MHLHAACIPFVVVSGYIQLVGLHLAAQFCILTLGSACGRTEGSGQQRATRTLGSGCMRGRSFHPDGSLTRSRGRLHPCFQQESRRGAAEVQPLNDPSRRHVCSQSGCLILGHLPRTLLSPLGLFYSEAINRSSGMVRVSSPRSSTTLHPFSSS